MITNSMPYKKILLISHLPLSDETNVGKTLNNLFSSYPEDKIMQLFFKNEGITRSTYDSFYIGDRSKGGVYKSCKNIENLDKRKNYFNFFRKYVNIRSPYMLLLRDLWWQFRNFEKCGLYSWIKSGNPQCIFLAPGYSIFAYNIAVDISNRFNIPLCIYFMEDFYNERRLSISPMYWLRYFLFRYNVRKCVNKSSKLFCLNEALNIEYRNAFRKPLVTLFNPASVFIIKQLELNNYKKLDILYGGSVGNSRIKVLLAIGNAVSALKSKGYDINFRIFGPLQTNKIENDIMRNKGIIYGGVLDSMALKEKIEKSNCVIHVESFEKKYIAKTKKAFSTKIPEYLASGNLLLAVGPSGIESIDYLHRTKSAIISHSLEKITDVLENIMKGNYDISTYLENAKKTVKENHDKHSIQELLYTEIADL